MHSIFLQGITPNDLKEMISEVLEEKLKDLPRLKQSNNQIAYLSRQEVADLLKISLTTLNDWSKQGIIQSYRIGNRVLYKKSEIEESLKKVANLKYRRGNHEA